MCCSLILIYGNKVEKAELKLLSEEFSSIDCMKKKNGQISMSEFIGCLGRLTDSSDETPSQADMILGEILFKAFDADGNGSIDYREFLATMAILSKGSIEQKLEFAFTMIDLNNDGKLSREEMQKVIGALFRVATSLGLGGGIQDPVTYANKLFDEMDEEKNGYLTLEAYKRGAMKHSGLFIGLGVLDSSEEETIQDQQIEGNLTILREKDLACSGAKPKSQGRIIGFGSRKWNLCLNMMIGIRLSSDCIGSISERGVRVEDFTVRLMFDLPKESSRQLMSQSDGPLSPRSAMIKESSYDPENIAATFIDYAPFVFKHIRQMSGISEEAYMLSLGPEQLLGNLLLGNLSTLSEHISDGKSGSFFFYSNDGRFLVKTISKSEVVCLKRILPLYYNHISQHPESLIVRILGFHEMILSDSDKVNFIVMGNVFSSSRSLTELYDLKGSTHGRRNPDGFCKKDLDLLEKGRKFQIGLENKLNYMKIIESDVEFLSKCNLLDYSLIVGVCKATIQSSTSDEMVSSTETDPFKKAISARLLRKNKCVCAIPSTNLAQEIENSELYYIGIIDILTEYNRKKETEHHLKSITSKSDTISAIPPKPYSERFFKFMYQSFE